MRRRISWVGCWALLAVLAFTFAPERLRAQGLPPEEIGEGGEGAPQDIFTRWNRAVDYFIARDYGRSRELLKTIADELQLKGKKEAAAAASRLADMAGDQVILQMLTRPEMGHEPYVIWHLYREWHRQAVRRPEVIAQFVERAVNPATPAPTRRLNLQKITTQIGQFAVPALAERLRRIFDDGYRTNAIAALIELGDKATLPVIELLDSPEKLVRKNACYILGMIQPPEDRAIAPLKRIWDDPEEDAVVKQYARRALERITALPIDQLRSAPQYYYLKADRYYLETPGVPIEAEKADGVIWRLNREGRLTYEEVPLYIWNELMAEEACYRALLADKDFDRILPLLASVYAAQYTEIKTFIDILAENRNALSDEERSEIYERDAKLQETAVLIRMMGAKYLYRGVGKALRDSRSGRPHPVRVAEVLMDAAAAVDPHGFGFYPEGTFTILPNSGGLWGKAPTQPPKEVAIGPPGPGETPKPRGPPRPLYEEPEARRRHIMDVLGRGREGEGRTIMDALDHLNKRVRYQAARTCAKMNPPARFRGSDEVIRILAEGIGESGPPQILLVVEDRPLATRLRELWAQEFDWVITVAHSGREGLAAAASFPPKDAIIIWADLRQGLTAHQFFDEMGRDPRLRPYLPGTRTKGSVVILSDRVGIEEARGRLGPNLVYIRHDVDDLNKVKKPVERVVYWSVRNPRGLINQIHAEEVSVACAQALAGIDPRRTVFRTTDCAEACLRGLQHRSNAVRIACATALGNFRIQKALQPLIHVFQDRSNSRALRLAALKAVGQIDPRSAFEFEREVMRTYRGRPEFSIRLIDAINIGQAKASSEDLAPLYLNDRERKREGQE